MHTASLRTRRNEPDRKLLVREQPLPDPRRDARWNLKKDSRRRTTGTEAKGHSDRVARGGNRDQGDRIAVNLKQDDRTIEHGTGGTHPSAEQRAMCSGLVLGMVSRVFNRSDLCETANRENA